MQHAYAACGLHFSLHQACKQHITWSKQAGTVSAPACGTPPASGLCPQGPGREWAAACPPAGPEPSRATTLLHSSSRTLRTRSPGHELRSGKLHEAASCSRPMYWHLLHPQHVAEGCTLGLDHDVSCMVALDLGGDADFMGSDHPAEHPLIAASSFAGQACAARQSCLPHVSLRVQHADVVQRAIQVHEVAPIAVSPLHQQDAQVLWGTAAVLLQQA